VRRLDLPYFGRSSRRRKTNGSSLEIIPMLQIYDADIQAFSLNPSLLQDILDYAKPLGHNEKPNNLNLGFGFLYYGLVRALRPRRVLVIGSGFGFSVVCLALGLKDNGKGKLTFVDPSFSVFKDGPFKTVGGTGQWNDPQKVNHHFQRFGLGERITHYKLTSQQFFRNYPQFHLPEIDIAFIDGSHAYDDVKHDFVQVVQHTHKNSYILLHDSSIYIREMVRHAGVKRWLKMIKKEKQAFETLDFPFSSGVALIRVLQDKVWKPIP
jgi:hypothetical protein